jgi:RecB family exonuclease
VSSPLPPQTPAAITPRRTRLVRVPDLARFQQAIALASVGASPFQARRAAVIVPTAGAADVLRHTIEDLCLVERWQPAEADLSALGAHDWPVQPGAPLVSVALPHLVTRAGLYGLVGEALADVARIDPIAREVLAGAVARDVAAGGIAPPFVPRPALVAAMLDLYDALRRNRRTIDDFERLVGTALESGAAIDRGAARLLDETRFLAAAFRGYEAALDAAGLVDEHGLRARALALDAAAGPLASVVVAVPDVAAATHGLWPADYDLLTRLAGLESVTVVATEATLDAGYLTRLLDTLPDIEIVAFAGTPPPAPRIVRPAGRRGDPPVLASRDREEEVTAFARRVRAQAGDARDAEASGAAASGAGPHAIALVHQRPLPYLYLARQVLGAYGISWQAVDALPLAAEPWAAAVDLVLTYAASDASRAAGLALLSSPLLGVPRDDGEPDPSPVTPAGIDACDRELADALFVGGRARLAELDARWREDAAAGRARLQRRRALPVVAALLRLAAALEPLATPDAASVQLDRLEAFLVAAERIPVEAGARERHLRARGAILGLLRRARDAYRRFGDPRIAIDEIAPLLRRLMEAQTFSPRVGPGLVHVVDAASAAFGRYADVTLAGLIESEWPAAGGRNVFVPASLLRDLGWPTDADRRSAARAAFDDLLRLPSRTLALSTFTLEDDAIVRPSAYLEDLDALALDALDVASDAVPRLALAVRPWPAAGAAGKAIDTPAGPRPWPLAAAPAGPASVGPRPPAAYSVTALDRYRQCPFKYFADDVLGLEEDVDDEAGLSARARGTLVHDAFQAFFTEWAARGGGAIDEAALPAARALFTEIAERALLTIPPSERPLERARLIGSAVGAGYGERAFRFEAGRAEPLVERLLEVPLDGDYTLGDGETARTVRLRGKADRVDLLGDGTLRVIDYKTGKASAARTSLQVKLYARFAAERLRGRGGVDWTVGESGYLAFGRPDDVYQAAFDAASRDEALAEAATETLAVVDAVERGAFPVAPEDLHVCTFCGFAAVCRKDYVGDE